MTWYRTRDNVTTQLLDAGSCGGRRIAFLACAGVRTRLPERENDRDGNKEQQCEDDTLPAPEPNREGPVRSCRDRREHAASLLAPSCADRSAVDQVCVSLLTADRSRRLRKHRPLVPTRRVL